MSLVRRGSVSSMGLALMLGSGETKGRKSEQAWGQLVCSVLSVSHAYVLAGNFGAHLVS